LFTGEPATVRKILGEHSDGSAVVGIDSKYGRGNQDGMLQILVFRLPDGLDQSRDCRPRLLAQVAEPLRPHCHVHPFLRDTCLGQYATDTGVVGGDFRQGVGCGETVLRIVKELLDSRNRFSGGRPKRAKQPGHLVVDPLGVPHDIDKCGGKVLGARTDCQQGFRGMTANGI